MAGIAALAKARGDHVTGIDANVYPPMSTFLEGLGISVKSGYDPAHLERSADEIVIGNVISRGNPVLEAILNEDLPHVTGPEWLAKNILPGKWRIVVSGTHGKTTVTSMIAWILEYAGLNPGFLVGGIPENFGMSARFTEGSHFVVEGDEYDTGFDDKRSKFIHYRPKTLVVNNMEYDHADIFPDIEAIKRQFHHVIRTVPQNGLIIHNPNYPASLETLKMGVWTPCQTVATEDSDWSARLQHSDGSAFEVFFRGESQGVVEKWHQLGLHNVHNALSAIAAAHHAGVSIQTAMEALKSFKGVKRRLQLRGEVKGVKVYDDFAHHPTAIETTLAGIKLHAGKGRLIAVIEPRSNTMRMGQHRDKLPLSLKAADHVFVYEPKGLKWDMRSVFQDAPMPVTIHDDIEALILAIAKQSVAQDHVVIMSNGGFENIHERLLKALS